MEPSKEDMAVAVAAMVAMGLGVNLKSIGRTGWRALAMGATLFATIALVTWLLVAS